MRPMWILLPLAVVSALLCDTVYLQGTGNITGDCCIATRDRRISSGVFKAYRIQSQNMGCPIAAVVLITKNNRSLCVTPGLSWVRKLMKRLDKMGQKSGKKEECGKRSKRKNLPTDE
nr:C-C motif chemokine ligand 21.S [Xenopus laevis]